MKPNLKATRKYLKEQKAIKPTEFVVYVRVSTKEQGRSGLGLEAQRRDIDLFLEHHYGKVIGRFEDIGSGADNDRPEFQKAVAMCQKEGATLLVAKLDRLSRRVSVISALMEQIHFRCANMPDANEFQLHIYAALAEQERKFISERTTAALRVAKENGAKLGGRRTNPEGVSALDEANAERAKSANHFASKTYPIIKSFLSQHLSLRQVAVKLNEAGITTQRGGSWDAKAVSRIVSRSEE